MKKNAFFNKKMAFLHFALKTPAKMIFFNENKKYFPFFTPKIQAHYIRYFVYFLESFFLNKKKEAVDATSLSNKNV
jgi:hypothetical protein